ncbi:MAG: CIA30 family protein [Chlorobiales bacterium]|nr:CIA30 family protein [Chlorobiales bacterium]
MSEQETLLFNFTSQDDAALWRSIDDVVMGGISQSTLVVTAVGTAMFEGYVSLENNGGFASVRTVQRDYELDDCKGILLRVKGDGKIYKFRIRTDKRSDGVTYEHPFQTEKGIWTLHQLPFSDFVPTFRGEVLSNQPPLQPDGIQQFGIMISNKQSGSFCLEIDWIKAYK